MTKEKCDYCNFESMNRATLIAYPENRQGFKFVYVGNDRKIHVDGRSSLAVTIFVQNVDMLHIIDRLRN